MKSSKSPQESFGTLPQAGQDTDVTPDTVIVPHADQDAKDLRKVRDLLFGATAQAHVDRMDAAEKAMAERMETMEREFQERLDTMEASVRADLKSEVASLVSRLDDHGTRKVERADLRSMLADLADRIGD